MTGSMKNLWLLWLTVIILLLGLVALRLGDMDLLSIGKSMTSVIVLAIYFARTTKINFNFVLAISFMLLGTSVRLLFGPSLVYEISFVGLSYLFVFALVISDLSRIRKRIRFNELPLVLVLIGILFYLVMSWVDFKEPLLYNIALVYGFVLTFLTSLSVVNFINSQSEKALWMLFAVIALIFCDISFVLYRFELDHSFLNYLNFFFRVSSQMLLLRFILKPKESKLF